MEKLPPSRLSMVAALAAKIGITAPSSTAEVFRKNRGRAPKGMKWATGVYVPGGSRPNVQPTKVRNPKIAAQVNVMYNKWAAPRGFAIAE